jgi:hypothetical protein
MPSSCPFATILSENSNMEDILMSKEQRVPDRNEENGTDPRTEKETEKDNQAYEPKIQEVGQTTDQPSESGEQDSQPGKSKYQLKNNTSLPSRPPVGEDRFAT